VHSCYVAVKSATNNSEQNSEIEQNSDENSDPDTVNDAKPQRKHISISKTGFHKCWWTPELDDLKQKCIDATEIWKTSQVTYVHNFTFVGIFLESC